MKTEITTSNLDDPIKVRYRDATRILSLKSKGDNQFILLDNNEIKQLRDFLNQLELK